ncbi:hypothetical protein BASA81_007286 [Batrachochytrium salamandrivorans]|nr:hypothetical protein BASA81_007286 [Batrachochytrium salamandrivorans]
MKVLLTGPFGNVGSNVVSFVLEQNSAAVGDNKIVLTCLDKKSPMTESNYNSLLKSSKLAQEAVRNGSLVVIWGDLTNAQDIKQAVAGQDAVIHLGAVIPPLAYTHPELARKVNVDGSRLLMETCNSQPKPPRFIFASSYSVHGPKNPHKNLPLMTGNTPVNPKDTYGQHKVECEQMIRKEYLGEWAILRLGAISVTLRGALWTPSSPQLEIMTNAIPGSQRRHGVHSKDVALAFINAAKSDKVNGKTLMIGGDKSWMTTSAYFYTFMFSSFGLTFPVLALREPPKEEDNAFYYEDWMDTTESQTLLQFQQHSMQTWGRELRSEVGVCLYFILRLVSPLAQWFLARKSMHYTYNRNGQRDPNASKTMTQLVLGQ